MQMNKKILVVFFAVIVMINLGYSQTISAKSAVLQLDGSYWKNSEKADKLLITTGMMNGFFQNSKILLESGNINDQMKKNVESLVNLLNEVSPGKIIAAIDLYYGEKGNSKKLIGDAFYSSLLKLQ
jgi:hypothetical protein